MSSASQLIALRRLLAMAGQTDLPFMRNRVAHTRPKFQSSRLGISELDASWMTRTLEAIYRFVSK
jgi:hypothetical protein